MAQPFLERVDGAARDLLLAVARPVVLEYLSRRVRRYFSLPGFPRYGLGWTLRSFALLDRIRDAG